MIQFYPSNRHGQDGIQIEVSCHECDYHEKTRPSSEQMAVFRAKLTAREHIQHTDHNVRIIRRDSTNIEPTNEP